MKNCRKYELQKNWLIVHQGPSIVPLIGHWPTNHPQGWLITLVAESTLVFKFARTDPAPTDCSLIFIKINLFLNNLIGHLSQYLEVCLLLKLRVLIVYYKEKKLSYTWRKSQKSAVSSFIKKPQNFRSSISKFRLTFLEKGEAFWTMRFKWSPT